MFLGFGYWSMSIYERRIWWSQFKKSSNKYNVTLLSDSFVKAFCGIKWVWLAVILYSCCQAAAMVTLDHLGLEALTCPSLQPHDCALWANRFTGPLLFPCPVRNLYMCRFIFNLAWFSICPSLELQIHPHPSELSDLNLGYSTGFCIKRNQSTVCLGWTNI